MRGQSQRAVRNIWASNSARKPRSHGAPRRRSPVRVLEERVADHAGPHEQGRVHQDALGDLVHVLPQAVEQHGREVRVDSGRGQHLAATARNVTLARPGGALCARTGCLPPRESRLVEPRSINAPRHGVVGGRGVRSEALPRAKGAAGDLRRGRSHALRGGVGAAERPGRGSGAVCVLGAGRLRPYRRGLNREILVSICLNFGALRCPLISVPLAPWRGWRSKSAPGRGSPW